MVTRPGDMDPDGLLALMETLTVPGKTLENAELDTAYRLVCACMHTMRQREHRLRDRCSDMPLLQVYMSDGWTCETSVRHVQNAGTESRVASEGKVKHEFLLERGILRCRGAAGSEDIVFQLGVPRALTKGKTHENFFAFACEFLKPARLRGHVGPLCSVLVLDGNPLNNAMGDLLEGRQSMMYSAILGDTDADYDVEELRDSEIYVRIRCKIHSTNKAVEWGLKPWCSPEIQDAAFITINSLRYAAGAQLGKRGAFLLQHVQFTAPEPVLAVRGSPTLDGYFVRRGRSTVGLRVPGVEGPAQTGGRSGSLVEDQQLRVGLQTQLQMEPDAAGQSREGR